MDALKVAAPATLEQIPELLDGIRGHTPVLFAGGALADERALLALASAVVRYDAAGICVGRNIFQRSNPNATLKSLLTIFRAGTPLETGFSRPMALDEGVKMVI
ncbi:fructose-bisphosphate aldolase [compost metagenome]